MLVCITGIDGVGKSTMTESLVHWLESQGIKACGTKIALFRNPAYQRYRQTLTWIKQCEPEVENELRAAFVTLEACRTIREIIIPSLEAFEIVISDRFVESSLFYLQARDLRQEMLATLSQRLPTPDITIFLDLQIENCVGRLVARGEHLVTEQITRMDRMYHLLREWAITTGAAIFDASLPKEELVVKIGQCILGEYEQFVTS